MAGDLTVNIDLPPRQAAVFKAVCTLHSAGASATAPLIARRLGLSRSTIRKHFQDLYRKRWLTSPGSPTEPAGRWVRLSS